MTMKSNKPINAGKPPLALEWEQQATFVQHCRQVGLFVIHIPNGEVRPHKFNAKGVRYSPAAQKLKKMGSLSGMPDLFCGDPIPTIPRSRGLFIEMKRSHKEQPSPDQIEVHLILRSLGYTVIVANGYDDGIRQMKQLGYRL